MTVKFAGKIRKGGNSYVVTVPVSFVKGGMLRLGQRYLFTTEAMSDAEQ